MKSIFGAKLRLNVPTATLVILCLFAIITGYYYYNGATGTKSTALFGGFLSGLLLVMIQFIFSWSEYRAMSKILSLGIKNIMLNRDDREFYQKLIKNANRRIDVMGVTSSRFMDHFADMESDRAETRVLLEALGRGASVRILVPEPDYLSSHIDITNASNTVERFKLVAEKYPNFAYKYFKHVAAHSIFVVDKTHISEGGLQHHLYFFQEVSRGSGFGVPYN